jgi:hypothetical protein
MNTNMNILKCAFWIANVLEEKYPSLIGIAFSWQMDS